MMLPDFDVIPSLRCSDGMYALERWPNKLLDQVEFLAQVAQKWGIHVEVHLEAAYEGYPGYIRVLEAGLPVQVQRSVPHILGTAVLPALVSAIQQRLLHQ